MTSTEPARDHSWRSLTRRVRFMTVVLSTLFLLGWLGWFYPFDDLLDGSGTPLGADFTMFYVAGQVAADGEWSSLYDQAEHQHRLQTLFPGIDSKFCLPYRYPPLVACAAAGLARLPYLLAFGIFLTCSVGSLVVSIVVWRRELTWLQDPRGSILLWAVAGWPVVLETLIGGQASIFAVLICTLSILFVRRKHDTLAGACLALAICKPNVLLLFGAGLVAYRPSILRGAIPVACGLVGLMFWLVGTPVMSEYLFATSNLAAGEWNVETPFWKVHSLSAWWSHLPGHRLAISGVGVAAAIAVGARWRARPDAAWLAIALLVTLNSLLNPYTPIYDLSLLSIAAFCFAQHYFVGAGLEPLQRYPVAHRAAPVGLYLALLGLYFGPHFSQSMAKTIGLQLFPLLMLFAAGWQARQLWQRVGRQHPDRPTKLNRPAAV